MRESNLKAIIAGFGIYHVLLGGLALFFPDTFFDKIGNYGIENSHYVGDVGALTTAFGVAFLLAVERPSWWAPLFWLGSITYAIHAFNHVWDIGEARSDARGLSDTLLIALGAVIFASLARAASKLDRERAAAAR